MRLSLCLDPSRPWAEAVRIAQRADAQNWYAVYQCDHFMPHDADDRPVGGPVTECWSTLSALAAVTTRVRLGSLVLGATYRHPAVVASMAATLDRISVGRLVLGVGAGWQVNEHRASGIPLPDPAPRLDAFEEYCAILRSLLDDGRATFEGTTYRLEDARCDPPPLQHPLPLLVGGGGERRTLRIAARYADVWHCWADPSTFAHKNAVLDAHCRDLGRDPREISRVTGGGLALGPSDRDVSGAAADVVAQLERYLEAGATEFVVRDHGTDEIERVLDQLDEIDGDVLPALRD